jgi:hypothetical protein
MSKHTPGPWSLHEHESLFVVGPDGNMVADTDMPADRGYRSPQCKANAKLIAAAPDLLAACKAAWLLMTPKTPGQHNAYRLLHEAIIKAEGGPQ